MAAVTSPRRQNAGGDGAAETGLPAASAADPPAGRRAPRAGIRPGPGAPEAPGAGGPALHTLVIGFGNPGRRDDGLGPALAARLEALQLPGVTVESFTQLSIEQALLVAGHDLVVFADAAADVADGAAFYLRPVAPAPGASCFSHHLSPAAVLQLAADCFDARPRAWQLGIRAIDLESFAVDLTAAAKDNLDAAVEAVRRLIEAINATAAQ